MPVFTRLSAPAWAIAVACVVATPEVVQSTPPRIPADAVAYWRLDTTRFAGPGAADPAAQAQRRILLAGLRAAAASGLIAESRAAGALDALLAASEVGARPHTLCLLDLAGERTATGHGLAPRTLRFALAIESSGDHALLLRTLRAILIGGDSDTAGGVQREITLPGAVRGVSYREPQWAAWHEIQWASTDDMFVIGLGAGSLERWFAAQAAPEPVDTPWAPHRAMVNRVRPAGGVFFEAYLGLDQARHGFPWGFIGGRVRRVLDTVNLSNARDVMMHARWVEPAADSSTPALIALDLTYSARSERPGVVRRVAVSEDHWPADLPMSPPPGTYAIAMRAPWGLWVHTALDLVWATADSDRADFKRAAIQGWLERAGGPLGRLLSRLEPWVVVSDVPPPIAPMPGASTFFVPIKPGVGAEAVSSEMRAVLADHLKRILIEDGVWSFKVDPGGVLRIPSWGLVGSPARPILVGGWGPPVVTENRRRLGDPRPGKP